MDNMENRSINYSIRASAATLINECDHNYRQQVHDAAEKIAEHLSRSRVILLSGPSGSSKTTTAENIAMFLGHYDVTCHVVSLDDYYLNRDSGKYPLDDEGNLDFESPLGLDIDLINEHMDALAKGKQVMLPRFDFVKQARDPEGFRPMQLGEKEAVIFEGINALNPLFTEKNPDAVRVFVAPTTPIVRKGKVLFDCEKIRLLRRTVRDYNFRGATPEDTLSRWASVRRGERLFILPYAPTADITIDSTLGYEVPVLGYIAKPLYEKLPQDIPQRKLLDEILEALPAIAPIAPEMVPESSLLRREFLKD